MRFLFSLFVGLWAMAASADTVAPPLPALFAVSGVAADDTLNIRAAPDGAADIVGTLAADAIGIAVTARSLEGNWGQVNVAEGTGWVAMRYLTAAPAPATILGLPAGLSCFGTEPFWDMAFLNQPNLILNTPEAESQHAILLTSPNPENMDLLRLGFLLQWQAEGRRVTAHILPGQCSDGMSDHKYGLHYIDDLGPRKGCCRLN